MTEQLKFEVGKHYRTRDGRKATLLLVRPNYMVGEVEGCPVAPTTWFSSGRIYAFPTDDELDLVAEWREPKRITVYWYRGVGRYSALEEISAKTRDQDCWQLIAKRQIVEGEGL